MNNPHQHIAAQIRRKLDAKGMTLEEVCQQHDLQYAVDIKESRAKRLNKDFLSRVQRGDFKVMNERISKLCEFLNVDIEKSATPTKSQLLLQIQDFQLLAETENQTLKLRFPALLNFLKQISNSF